MFRPTLARDVAALGRVTDGASCESVLRGITRAVTRGVPGCSAGTAALWREGPMLLAASHSELIALVDRERELRQGPSREAFATGRPVVVAETLDEGRWPGYAVTAVRYGVRSILVLPIEVERAALILCLYGVRPGVFTPSGGDALATVLAEQATVTLANIWDYQDVLTGQAQMREALAGRAVIDQAKGIIMRTSGCSAEAAFDELRRISQHHQVKVVELARLLIDEHRRDHAS
ncbi:MAG TPA: GAF and ANTAR domain-containing protein [Thermopolyspora sp.]